MKKRKREKLTLASLISPLDFKVVAAVSYSGAKLSSAQFTPLDVLHKLSSTHFLQCPHPPQSASYQYHERIHTRGKESIGISKVQNKGTLVTYSTKARSSPRTDDLNVSSVRSSTSDANVVAKNGRIASRAPDNFILIVYDMSKVYKRVYAD
jgi:hypothetical protein